MAESWTMKDFLQIAIPIAIWLVSIVLLAWKGRGWIADQFTAMTATINNNKESLQTSLTSLRIDFVHDVSEIKAQQAAVAAKVDEHKNRLDRQSDKHVRLDRRVTWIEARGGTGRPPSIDDSAPVGG